MGFPLEFGTDARGQKMRMMGYWVEYTNVTDTHLLTAKTALTHSVVR